MTYPGGWRPVPYAQRCVERRAVLEDALRTAVDACRRRPDVAKLIVFGSFARGQVSPWSDLDLLVVADDDAAAAVTALYTAGTLGDVLGTRACDVSDRLAATALGRTILAEGIEVYARPTR